MILFPTFLRCEVDLGSDYSVSLFGSLCQLFALSARGDRSKLKFANYLLSYITLASRHCSLNTHSYTCICKYNLVVNGI